VNRQTSPWLSDFRQLFFRYLAVGLCFGVAGLLHAMLSLNGMEKFWSLTFSFGIGLVLACYVWSRTGKTSTLTKPDLVIRVQGIAPIMFPVRINRPSAASIVLIGLRANEAFAVRRLGGNDSTAAQYDVACSLLSSRSTRAAWDTSHFGSGNNQAAVPPELLNTPSRGEALLGRGLGFS